MRWLGAEFVEDNQPFGRFDGGESVLYSARGYGLRLYIEAFRLLGHQLQEDYEEMVRLSSVPAIAIGGKRLQLSYRCTEILIHLESYVTRERRKKYVTHKGRLGGRTISKNEISK